ncbi:MFS transporter [Brackiella oedipodis]|uniref:MFS transporter n=1 Tax=Brackiella oedipodis TaxID=124225 RepID=UPI000684BFF3|nr:MFS transporter [Brackiella oedipodis]
MDTEQANPETAPNTMGYDRRPLPLWVLCIMSSVTFMAVISEISPSGILPQMAQSLGVSVAQAGNLVGLYAFPAALCAIPMIALTAKCNRKTLLMTLLAGFAVCNLIIAISSSFYLTSACRMLAGVCAGTMWPMIGTYGMRLVDRRYQGRATVIIFSGTSLATSIGMPVISSIGLWTHWRVEFFMIALILLTQLYLAYRYLPSIEGVSHKYSETVWSMLKNRYVVSALVLTCFGVIGAYAGYIYITVLVRDSQFMGGVPTALFLFGVGAIATIFIAARWIDQYFQQLTVILFAMTALSMLLLVVFKGTPLISHLAFVLWGLGYGILSTNQAAIVRNVNKGRDISISMQVATYNFSIMIASSVGGLLLAQTNIMVVISIAGLCSLGAALLAFFDKKTYGNHPL